MNLGEPTRPDLAALFRPKSIAVLGASDRVGVGQRVVANLDAVGFDGDLFLVNPNRPVVGRRPTFPSISALPATPDLVISAVNRTATVDGLIEAASRGCPAGIVLAAGFGETGQHGRELEAHLREAAGTMALMGPNCLGYVNLIDRVAPYSGPLMEPPASGVTALISQSGALACTITGAAAERSLLFSHVITTGNQIGVTLADYIGFLSGVPEVRTVACYVEGFHDGRVLLSAMDAAQAAGKTVVVLKAGRSRVGGMAARTHTGSLAGSASVQLSVWRQHGVLVADDLEEFLALMELTSRVARLPGGQVGVVTISGGERLLFADAAEELGVPLAPFAEATSTRLREVLPEYASVANPLDTTGAGVVDGNSAAHGAAAFTVAQDPNVDVLVACQDAKNGWTEAEQASPLFHECVQVAADAAQAAGKPLVVISPSSGAVDRKAGECLRARGIPLLSGLRTGVAALAKLVAQNDPGDVAAGTPPLLPNGEGVALSGVAALRRLEDVGVDVWTTRLARTEDEAVELAKALGYPVAIKADGPGLQHRTELGGVRTGVSDDAAVRAAWRDVTGAVARAGMPISGALVQPMAPSGVEVFVGGIRDEQFGPVILAGPGGILLELIGDVAAGLAPLDLAAARKLLLSSRLALLLRGVRGAPPADLDALAASVSAISRLVAAPDVLALDVNPLIASPTGIALVDAKLVVRADEASSEPTA